MNKHKKSTLEKIKVMQAYVDGEKIECKCNYSKDPPWSLTFQPAWDWACENYRIAPKTKELWWAILRKNDGQYITTNPKPKNEHDDCIAGYGRTATLISEYSSEFPN